MKNNSDRFHAYPSLLIIASNLSKTVKAQYILILFMLFPLDVLSQDNDGLNAILTITGYESEDMLDEEMLEQFDYMEKHPVTINTASASTLSSCGLFSQYQIASLLDYIDNYGDVLSVEELSAINGFGPSYAQALRPYIDFYSDRAAGSIRKPRSDFTATIRSTYKSSYFTYKGKATYSYADRFSAFMSYSPSAQNVSFSYNGSRILEKLIIGDFNARFGQGLVLWNSMSMSGISAPSSMYRRPSGLSQFNSYSTTSLRGIATALRYKGLNLTCLTSFPWLRQSMAGIRPERFTMVPAINLSWYSKYGQIGLTSMCVYGRMIEDARLSLDARFCYSGIDAYAEIAIDIMTGKLASVAGVGFPIGGFRFGVLGRYYPVSYPKTYTGAIRAGTYSRDEAGVGLSMERESLIVSVDWYKKLSTKRDQLKIVAVDEIQLTEAITLKPRVSFRWRNDQDDCRTDIRNDLFVKRERWAYSLRLNWLYSVSNAWLTYSEYALLRPSVSAYARLTLFRIDNWNDRIYSYERDAPGNLSIPAYYGRGFRLNLYASWKKDFRKGRIRLYVGGGWTSYPWKTPGMAVKKPGETGLGLQSVMDF